VLPTHPQVALALTALFSGVALVISIATHASLGVILAFTGVAGGCAAVVTWLRADAGLRPALKTLALTGALAGVAATAGYDTSRLFLVHMGGLKVSPVDTLALFGRSILGGNAAAGSALIVGTAYHYLNGIGFSIGYCYLFGGKDWRFGVLWALGLEAAMVAIYPGWLDLKAVMGEFAAVSLTGHVVYGAILGRVSQVRLVPRTPAQLLVP
jgi:hypothetical protein